MTRPLRLGCIADDFTGATDLANNLVKSGLRTVQTIGIPDDAAKGAAHDGASEHADDRANDRASDHASGHASGGANDDPGDGADDDADLDADAIVVALKSRTIPAADAVAQSLAALAWLRAHGAAQIYFKYCSTFDSTPAGNIGPVADALLDALAADFAIACPAFPENGRTIFNGHLFVGDVLLSDSGMRDHPLTPMTDANLVRVLQAQTPSRVGLVAHDVVARGADAIRARCDALKADGVRLAIVDAVADADLFAIGAAVKDMPLVTAGSGVAIGLARNGASRDVSHADRLPAAGGFAAIVSGSCSQATNAQVAHFVATGRPTFAVDPLALALAYDDAGAADRIGGGGADEADGAGGGSGADEADGTDAASGARVADGAGVVARALAFADTHLASGPVLIHATASPDAVRRAQSRLGVARAGAIVEDALAAIAQGLVARGVRRLVVAGGETSGAVVNALGIRRMTIGPQIDPGVPWTAARAGAGTLVHLALKSGNFGTTDFFTKAFDRLAS